MKKLLLIVVVLSLVSCRSSQIYKTETYFTDFRPFSEKGFLMTTQPISTNYQTIGEISLQCTAGYDSKNKKKLDKVGNDIYFRYTKETPPIQCEVSDILNEVYLKAKELGANGLVQLKVEYSLDKGRIHQFNNITVTGLAVKIEK